MAVAASLVSERAVMAQIKASLVKDADNPARQPISLRAIVNVSAGAENGYARGIYQVPAGKRLTIDYIALNNTTPNGETALSVFVASNASIAYAEVTTSAPLANLPQFHYSTASQQVHMFANPGDLVDVGLSTNGGSGASFTSVVLNGYLVDLP